MEKDIKIWLLEKWHAWEVQSREKRSEAQFAQYLGVDKKALNHWMNGRNQPSFQSALKIAETTKAPEILSILGYSLPSGVADLSLPPSLKSSFDTAVDEIERTYKARGITDLSSPEALQIAKEILKQHGWTVTT